MKIAIITILDNINIGTILQAYATGDVLESLGHEVLFIDYRRPTQTIRAEVISKLNGHGSFPRRLLNSLISATIVPLTKKKLRQPLTARFNFTKKYFSALELQNNCPKADLYMTGSDQVWNCSYNAGIDHSYFLDFTKGHKCAYAASIGTISFPENSLLEIKELLKQYDFISVREMKSCDYLHNIGFHKSKCALDPTLLLSKEEWLNKYGINNKNRLIKDKYILVYSVEASINDFIYIKARKIADMHDWKVVGLTASDPRNLKKYKTDRIFGLADTKIFLHLLRDAEFVIASSFHGTAFSINFNKQFITITPPRFNIRIENIINLFNLKNRIITGDADCCDCLNNIDYSVINRKLHHEKEKSLNILRTMINFYN